MPTKTKTTNGKSKSSKAKSTGNLPNATVELDGDELVIRCSLSKPKPSGSGKTLSVYSTGGNKASGIEYNGKELVIGVNAYFYPNER